MKIVIIFETAVLLSACIVLSLSAAAKNTSSGKIPVRDFFRNAEKTSFQISPDGEYISWLEPWKNRMNVVVRKRAGGSVVRVTSETERDIAGYFWKGNGGIVFLRDYKGDENFHLFSVDINGNNSRDLTPFDKVRASVIDDLEDSDTDMIVGLNKRNPEISDAYRINVKTGDIALAAENPGNITGWMTDHAGKIRIAVTSDGSNTSLLYRDDESTPFRTVVTTNFRESIDPLFFTFDDKYVYASSNIGRDKSAIVKYDIAHAKELEMVFAHPDVDVHNLNYSKKRKVLTTSIYTTWKDERKYFDPLMKNMVEGLQKKFPGKEISVSSANKEERFFIVRTSSDRTRGSWYISDTKTNTIEKLSDISPWLDETQMCEMKPVTYTSRDGLTINGYLTLPCGVKPENLPLIVNPHGGPWVRDEWGFNSEVQFLASRGYAVLQVNYRGSTGYGRKFWEASFKQWGKKMQDDVSDGVMWLTKKGIVNAKRVAIYGGSYGGYATLAGLAFTPELYACGVDYVGVSNLLTFMNTIPPYWKPFLEQMHEMVGDPEKEADLLRAASPVFHADRIRAPLFVAQGAKDPRVNINESDQIVNALKKRGIAVEYMIKENEGHGFHNEENRFAFYEAMEKFLETHLSGK